MREMGGQSEGDGWVKLGRWGLSDEGHTLWALSEGDGWPNEGDGWVK